MAATGEISLDISKFEGPLADAIADLARLGERAKQETAVLALMERQFRTLGQASGITAKDIRRQMGEVEQLGIKHAKTKKEIEAYNAAMGKSEATQKGLIPTLSKLRTNIGLIFSGVAVGAVVSFGKSLLEFGTRLADTSKIAGVLPEKLQRVQAALASKLSADDTASALTSLNRVMNEARTGSADAEEKLAQLGVTFEDLTNKSPDEVILQLADHVKNAVDPVEELRRVSAVFGDDMAAKLIPALRDGGAAIKELGDKATVASDGMVALADSGSKALARLGTSVKQHALGIVGAWSGIIDYMRGKGQFDFTEDEAAIARLESKLKRAQIARSQGVPTETQRHKTDIVSGPMEGPAAPAGPAPPPRTPRVSIREREIQLNKELADKQFGYASQQRVAFGELAKIEAEMAGEEGLRLERLKAQHREIELAIISNSQAHADELTQLKYATAELQSQMKGENAIAAQLAISAKYEAEIVKQKRLGNAEAVKELRAQEAIELKRAQAARHDETPRDRVNQRREARAIERKASQQDARDLEQQGRAARGVYGSHALDQVSKLQESRRDRAAREAQADQDTKNIGSNVKRIADEITSK